MRRCAAAFLSMIVSAVMVLIPFNVNATAAEKVIALNEVNFPDPGFRRYLSANEDVNGDGVLNKEECYHVTTIIASDVTFEGPVRSLEGIANFPYLTSVSITNHSLRQLDVSVNKRLERLYISEPAKDSALTALDLSKNKALMDLTFYGDLEQLVLPEYGSLVNLWIPNTSISSLTWPKDSVLNNVNFVDTPMIAARFPETQGSFNPHQVISPLRAKDVYYDPSKGSYDLKDIVPWFDGSKVSNVSGATMNGSVVSGLEDTVTMQYDYATGLGDISPVLVFKPLVPQSVELVSVSVVEGRQPALPSTVDVRYTDGRVRPMPVRWSAHDWSSQKAGTVTVSGAISDISLNATATVTVTKLCFQDVNGSTPHAPDIQWLVDNGISTGWQEADGSFTFRGMSPVVRQDMAAFLRREAVKRGVSDAATWKPSDADWKRFKDVNSSTSHAEDILWLAHAGISKGWQEPDGTATFRGMNPVVRQDMAAFLKRLADAAGKSGGVKPKTDFNDVRVGQTPHWAAIQWLGSSGISTGYRNANGSWRFEGMTSVYRQDMAAFIHRLDNRLA